MEQDHLPCSCDQEVFERVWRRVMPEDRPDCPFTLGEDAAAPPAIQPPRRLCLPWYILLQPANRRLPARGGRRARRALPGAPSAVYGSSSSGSLTGNWRIGGPIRPLSRRAQGNSGRVLATIAADERRHAKRLSTAYFLISGVRYWPVDRVPNPSPAPSPPPCGSTSWRSSGGGRLPDRGGGDRRSLPPRALSGAGGGGGLPRLAPAQRTGAAIKNTPAHGFAARRGLLLVSVDHSVQHPGRHGARRVRTGAAVLHQHHEGVGGVGVAEEAGEPGVGALPPPPRRCRSWRTRPCWGKREAPY